MKIILLLILSIMNLSQSFGQSMKLSAEEIKLLNEIDLDLETAKKIKLLASGDFELAIGADDRDIIFEDLDSLKNYYKNLPKAVKINAKPAQAVEILNTFKENLKQNNLVLYISEQNYGTELDVITIIKTSMNPYILKPPMVSIMIY